MSWSYYQLHKKSKYDIFFSLFLSWKIPESLREPDPGQQEEKLQDSTQPPSKEQKEVPEEPGPSKLLPRKRSGANRPAVVKFKRKTQAFTRLYSNEMYDKDDTPLLGMFPTSRSLTVEEVQTQINSLLVTIAQVGWIYFGYLCTITSTHTFNHVHRLVKGLLILTFDFRY